MKKILLVFLFVFLVFEMHSQEKSNAIGVSYSSFGKNHYSTAGLDGTGNYSDDDFYYIGLTYTRSLSKVIELVTGLEYSKHNIISSSSFMPMSGLSESSTNHEIELIEIPLNGKINIGKFFFVNAGILVDFDITSNSTLDDQSGIGFNGGVGFQYKLESGFNLYVNPHINGHSIIPFKSDENHQKLSSYGLKIGVNYYFN